MEKVALEAHNPYIKNKVYWIVFPTYAEAKESVWKDPNMLFRVIPHELIERKNEVELTIYLRSGSIISLKGADKPDSLRGAGPYGITFDEFATMKYMAWQVMEPVVRANGGWAWFIGTPKGKNHLYDSYNRGNKDDEEWKSWLLKGSTSGIIPQEELDSMRNSPEGMTQALYNQEIECDFLEGEGQVFRNVRAICNAVPEKPQDGHLYVMGVDLAKHQDYTVIVIYDRATNKQVYQDRFQKIEWPFQKKKIIATAQHYNNALTMLDATGIGDPIADDLLRAGLSVEPYKFTAQSKKDLVEKLTIWIEQQKISMIKTEHTLLEFDNYTYELSITGGIRYGAPSGYHDDIVTAHALAVFSLQPIYAERVYKKKTHIQRLKSAQVDHWDQQENQEWQEWGKF